MKYIAIFHANLNYAYLTEDRYEFVIRQAYEMILDTMRERFPGRPIRLRGLRLHARADRPAARPDVLEKLKAAIAQRPVRVHGLALRPPDAAELPGGGRRLVDRVLQRDLRAATWACPPRSFWNPECGWRSYRAAPGRWPPATPT